MTTTPTLPELATQLTSIQTELQSLLTQVTSLQSIVTGMVAAAAAAAKPVQKKLSAKFNLASNSELIGVLVP